VIYDLIGPLPGEPWSATPAIVSLSGLICVLAFFLYTRREAQSLPARIVTSGVGYIALGYIALMGLMLARLVYQNSGAMESALSGGLLDMREPSTSSAIVQWLFQALSAPFAFAFGCLAICNLYVADAMIGRVLHGWDELHTLGERSRVAQEALETINTSAREIDDLEGKRAALLRELEPAASFTHANELAAMVQEARAPLDSWLAKIQLRKKAPASVLHGDDGPDIDVPKFKERVNALNIDAKVIYAAFRGEEDGRKRS
jgi:hypothetical protein